MPHPSAATGHSIPSHVICVSRMPLALYSSLHVYTNTGMFIYLYIKCIYLFYIIYLFLSIKKRTIIMRPHGKSVVGRPSSPPRVRGDPKATATKIETKLIE